MSLLGSIMDKIFHHGGHAAAPAPAAQTAATAPPAATPAPAAQPTAAAPVDVEQVLEGLAAQRGDGGGNWRTSIVDLLKLLDLDSSLAARKGLAQELNVHAGPDGSAEENIALSKAVWAQLAANGGHVPASLKD